LQRFRTIFCKRFAFSVFLNPVTFAKLPSRTDCHPPYFLVSLGMASISFPIIIMSCWLFCFPFFPSPSKLFWFFFNFVQVWHSIQIEWLSSHPNWSCSL
jgi:hypothetical protein